MIMHERVSGLLGNHFFQVAALIAKAGSEPWSLPDHWETPLYGSNAKEHLLVSASTCPSIWNAAPYLRGPFNFRKRDGTEKTIPAKSYLSEKHWRGHEAKVKSTLGYSDKTKADAKAVIGDGSNACAIHIRRGEKKALQHWYGPAFHATYIHGCVKDLPPDTRYFLFSDEPKWARQCLESIGIKAENGEDGVKHPVQAMARMSECRYFIGANSTMTWWAGYLNEREDKKIFMPEIRRDDQPNDEKRLREWLPASEKGKWEYRSARKKLAVIIAAHKAERFIADCLAGFRAQTPAEGWDVEVRIGVDGCKDTARKLNELGEKYWYSPRNVGAYVIRNSLIRLAPADAYDIFDADDVPMPDFTRDTLAKIYSTGIVTCSRQEVGENLEDIGLEPYVRCNGRAMFSADAWAQAGGFREDRVDCDGDMVARLEHLGYSVTQCPEKPLMLRRQHSSQLTKTGGTRLGGSGRRIIRERHKTLRRQGKFRVEPVTTPLDLVVGGKRKGIDAVILYRKDGGNELPYCVSGLRKHLTGLRNIYVIGDNPDMPGVIRIPHGDKNTKNLEANMIRKVLAACANKKISDPFLLCANDEIFIKDVALKDYPLYWTDKTASQSDHGRRIAHTQKAIEREGLNYRYFDGHVPVLIHKAVYKEAMSLFPWDTDIGPGILCRTPYGCLLESRGAKLVKVRDPKTANCACDAPVVSKPGHIPKKVAQKPADNRTFNAGLFRRKALTNKQAIG